MHADAPTPAAPSPTDTHTVLLAEDETQVRRILKRVLDLAGFRVLEARSGAEALELWAREKARISLLLTDMIMPGGVSGRQLATRLSLEKPELKVIYSSGYVPAGVEALTLPGAVFVPKPFSPDQLVRAVQALLGLDELTPLGA